MGNNMAVKKTNFQDMQYFIENNNALIINTSNQNCLIHGTIPYIQEESVINSYLTTNLTVNIIIYGKNSQDDSIYAKHKQLTNLGFTNVYVYTGGLFEWILLQELYGENEFPTNEKVFDILEFKGMSYTKTLLLENKV